MKVAIACFVTAAMAPFLIAQTPTPTVPPSGEASRPRLLGFGFGAAQNVQAPPAPSKPASAEGNPLAGVASQTKLRKLTPEEKKQLKAAGPMPAPTTEDSKPGEVSNRQKVREEAWQEWLEARGPLVARVLQADAEWHACSAACSGTSGGSGLTADANGYLMVISMSFDNSSSPECRRCSSMCWATYGQLASEINAARQRAFGKGILRHEIDVGHLVFSDMKD